MVSIETDEEVDTLEPRKYIEHLAGLLSLLCGLEVNIERLKEASLQQIKSFLGSKGDDIHLSYAEFNELLLLFNQGRVERPFFDFFFLQNDPRAKPINAKGGKQFVTLDELKKGVRRFRCFALLCFGNFRFAFRKLSEEKDPIQFWQFLDPWNRDSKQEINLFRKREKPLTPLVGTQDEIGRDKTWFVGKFSSSFLKSDGLTLAALSNELAKKKTISAEENEDIKELNDELEKAREDECETRTKAALNSIKYLTWDYLDVYVATSMRQPWEYEETHDFIGEVFRRVQKDIPNVRWFDPTQADLESTIDKGLLEGLMLKRAKCTIYMAQEGDTLGKDSELAATLAQGKPVIAYVHPGDLSKYEKELKNRRLSYFRQRLLTLLADGFRNVSMKIRHFINEFSVFPQRIFPV